MSLFDIAKLFAPIGGAVGIALAVPNSPAWMLVAIPLGLAFGFGCYRGLIRLAIGKHDKNPQMPGWRVAAFLSISLFSPFVAGALSFGLAGLFFRIIA